MKRIAIILFILVFAACGECFAEKYKLNQYPENSQTVTQNGEEIDFRPWMNETQRRINMNWEPLKGTEYLYIVLELKVDKSGKLLSNTVYRSSDNRLADKAALNAVQLAAPFRPLPQEYKGNDVTIYFTFGYPKKVIKDSTEHINFKQ